MAVSDFRPAGSRLTSRSAVATFATSFDDRAVSSSEATSNCASKFPQRGSRQDSLTRCAGPRITEGSSGATLVRLTLAHSISFGSRLISRTDRSTVYEQLGKLLFSSTLRHQPWNSRMSRKAEPAVSPATVEPVTALHVPVHAGSGELSLATDFHSAAATIKKSGRKIDGPEALRAHWDLGRLITEVNAPTA